MIAIDRYPIDIVEIIIKYSNNVILYCALRNIDNRLIRNEVEERVLDRFVKKYITYDDDARILDRDRGRPIYKNVTKTIYRIDNKEHRSYNKPSIISDMGGMTWYVYSNNNYDHWNREMRKPEWNKKDDTTKIDYFGKEAEKRQRIEEITKSNLERTGYINGKCVYLPTFINLNKKGPYRVFHKSR